MITPETHAVLTRIGSYRRWRLHNVPSQYRQIVEALIMNDWIYLDKRGHLYLTLTGHEALYDANNKKIQTLGGYDNE